MTAQLIGQYEVGSEAWHEARRTRVGGSEAAAILGLSRYESRFSLYHRKLGLAARQVENAEMEWGKRLEPAVLTKWLDSHADTHELVERNGSWLSDSHPFMLANPDMLVRRKATGALEVVEAKTSPYGDDWGPAHTDVYPVGYRVQCLHYGHVLQVPTVHLAVLVSGCDYREYTIDMTDAEAVADLVIIIDAEKKFIDDVEHHVRPEIDEHEATYEVVRSIHPEIEAKEEVELTEELAARYVAAKAELKRAEDEHMVARSLVMDAMGNANYALHNGVKIARRQAKGDGKPFLVACKTTPTAKKVQAAA